MAAQKLILVTGSTGQLGSELQELAPAFSSFRFLFLSREKASIEDTLTYEKLFQEYKPAFLINCAGYTAVDKAESEKDKAFEINGYAVGRLAQLCALHHTGFIHISTDYVFDGNAQVPLTEEDIVDPVNLYGASKLLGEELVQQHCPDSIIIRTSWVYSYYGKNFVKTMMKLMHERDSVSVVADQYGSPTYAADLANAIMQIIEADKWLPGIYHFSNDGIISWFDFAQEIKLLSNSTATVNPIPTSAYPTPAKRPAYSVLDKQKIRNTFHVTLQPWRTSLKKCIEKLNRMEI